MSRQMYAITCRTDIASKKELYSFVIRGQMNMHHVYIFLIIIEEHLMNEIREQFPTTLQYACVSMDYSQCMATFRTIYIQIILKKVVNKNGWFLDKATGTYDRRKTWSYSSEIIHHR